MQLRYIWIKDSGPIKNLGLNFNTSFKDKFEYTDGKLKITPTEKSVLDFGERITGVNVIAGQNGAGKTTVLETILGSVATKNDNHTGWGYKFDGIVILDDTIFIQEGLELTNQGELKRKEPGFEIIRFKVCPFENNTEAGHPIAGTAFIYYSNHLDRRAGIEAVNLKNISSQGKINSPELSPYFYMDYGARVEESRFDTLSHIEIYHRECEHEVIRFLVQNQPTTMPVSDIRRVKMDACYQHSNRFLTPINNTQWYDEIEQTLFDNIYPNVLLPVQDTREITLEESKVKSTLKQLYRLNLLRGLSNMGKEFTQKEIHGFVWENKYARENPEEIAILLRSYDSLITSSECTILKFSPLTASDSVFFEKRKQDWRFYIIESVLMQWNEESGKAIREVINMEEKLLQADENGSRSLCRITSFGFAYSVSTGEASLLNLFSRLHREFENYKNSVHDEKDTLVLIIDEGEVGFHPKWKKEFFSRLINFLNKYPIEYKFQLLLTTHSPFILSDVSDQEVILLEKEGEVSSLKNNFKTFGANIHEILSNSFFLNDGTIGNFAKSTIQSEVIDKLLAWNTFSEEERSKVSTVETKKVLSHIRLIADNIVRSKLHQWYTDMFGDFEAIESELERLRSRINELENRKGKEGE